jgi:hypothetical protein
MTLDEIINKNIAINFGNKENATLLLKYLDSIGHTWCDGKKYTENLENFVNDKTNIIFDEFTCIIISVGKVHYYEKLDEEELKYMDINFENDSDEISRFKMVDFCYKVIDFKDLEI